MHPNPVFHTQSAAANLDYARARGFGMLAVNGPDGPLLAHVPFLLDADGGTLWLHLIRSNPIARVLQTPLAARIAVVGPDAYISPDWYEVPDQVPTWNYIAVHLSGPLELCPPDSLHDVIARQSTFFEAKLAPKKPWQTGKMTPDVLERMMRAIVACRMQVERVDGTWKLNQNKPADVRLRAVDAMEQTGIGAGLSELAALMRAAGRDDGHR